MRGRLERTLFLHEEASMLVMKATTSANLPFPAHHWLPSNERCARTPTASWEARPRPHSPVREATCSLPGQVLQP